MENEKNSSNYQPDITNYDYVWGSDQSEYVKDNSTSMESEQEQME